MNVALEQAEEWVGGALQAKYGDCFLRGNGVMYVAPAAGAGGASARRR